MKWKLGKEKQLVIKTASALHQGLGEFRPTRGKTFKEQVTVL